MADKYTVKAARSGGKASIDAGMAALAALSVGFFGYAMPAAIFQGLAGASLAAAAEPGSSARLAAVAGAAALTFVLIFALLRALGRLPAAGQRRSRAAEVPAEPPRLRRADAHPDAPARWPLFAGSELGDPIPAELPESEKLPEEFAAAEQPIEEPVETTAEEAPQEEPLVGLLAGGLDISDGEPVDRPAPQEAERDRPLPSFIAPAATDEDVAEAAPEGVGDTEAPVVETVGDEAATVDEAPMIVEPIETGEEAVEEEPAAIFDEEEAVTADSAVAIEEEPAAVVEEESAAIASDVFVPFSEPEPEAVVEAPEAAAVEIAEESVEPLIDAPVAVEDETPAVAEEEVIAEMATDAFVAPEEEPFTALQEPVIEEECPAAEMPAWVEEEASGIEDAPVSAPSEVADEPIEAIVARLLPEPRDESVSELMGRLEVGLGRRDRAHWLGQQDVSAEDAGPPADDRLRNALGMLRRMAGRKG